MTAAKDPTLQSLHTSRLWSVPRLPWTRRKGLMIAEYGTWRRTAKHAKCKTNSQEWTRWYFGVQPSMWMPPAAGVAHLTWPCCDLDLDPTTLKASAVYVALYRIWAHVCYCVKIKSSRSGDELLRIRIRSDLDLWHSNPVVSTLPAKG